MQYTFWLDARDYAHPVKLLPMVVAAALAIAGCSSGTNSTADNAATIAPASTTESGPDMTALTQQVKQSMQGKLSTDPNFEPLKLTVRAVQLVHSQGNDYKGIATVETHKGTQRDVAVAVTFDGTNMVWQTEDGAFLWTRQDGLPPASP